MFPEVVLVEQVKQTLGWVRHSPLEAVEQVLATGYKFLVALAVEVEELMGLRRPYGPRVEL